MVIVFDITGKRVWQMPISAGTTHLDLSPLTGGIYLAVIQTDGKTAYQQKIIKR